ncbi:MAG: cyclic nucleotide-binding domain-containing protein [Desulfobulbaceae bacterium]|nr:cyclic nucleotide-binding domain-containing protein [Desulfobulbaceae bacterium]
MSSTSPSVPCDLVTAHAESAFRFLTDDELEIICPYLQIRRWPSDSVLMREGEPGDFMGFLVEGKLAVRKETSFAGKHILLAILEPGTMVGEISVVAHEQRNASVVATEESTLLELTSESFDLLVKEHPVLGVKFLSQIVSVVSLRLRKADDRLARLL